MLLGEQRVASPCGVETRIRAATCLKAAVRIAPAIANVQRTGLVRRMVYGHTPDPLKPGMRSVADSLANAPEVPLCLG